MDSPEKINDILEKLNTSLIETLSPEDLRSEDRVNASIYLSYQYLDVGLQEMGKYLALFPGSFDKAAACKIIESMNISLSCSGSMRTLVRRSLLEYNQRTERYVYHKLIREFFRNEIKSKELKKRFNLLFLEYYITVLEKMTKKEYTESIHILDTERHNIQYLFDQFNMYIDIGKKDVRTKIFMNIIHAMNHFMSHNILDFRFKVESQSYLKIMVKYLEQNRYHIMETFSKEVFVKEYSDNAFN